MKLAATAHWLDIDALPALLLKGGEALPEVVLIAIIGKQANDDSIQVVPDNIPVFSHVYREKSGEFALALLQQWLLSEKQTKDRWVLTLAGFLGDQKILPALMAPIDGWVKASRYKLAEYAAQAIALMPEEGSLMMLDSLADRYWRRFRNIGKACNEAQEKAAELQGVSMDELADIIVPTLEFNTQCQRALIDTDVLAVLQADFKLMFPNPTTGALTKSPPSSSQSSTAQEITTVRKLIRETLKIQTARLEKALVC